MNKKVALKSVVLGFAIAIATIGTTNAQTPIVGTTYSGPAQSLTAQASQAPVYQDVTVNLNLLNVVEFVVNKNWTEVLFDSYTKYTNGTSKQEDEQFTVSSNRGFDITIKPQGATFVNGQNTIPVADVDLTANKVAGWDGTVQNASQTFTPAGAVILDNTNDQVLVSSNGALNDKFGVLYHAKGGKDFIVPPGVYSQVVRFTLTQK